MKRIALALALMAAGMPAALAGTNFPPLADYPGPNCGTAEKPADVPPFKNGDDVAAYTRRIKQHNEQVVQYNKTLHDHTACMNDYVANAQADMDAIRDKVNKAVAAAQSP
ncbi:MAG TPA: hypothetical protein VN718_08205 [Rhizomicrobium sp.]|nr:hypothetical protein [Rhizomicrobium sp.]